MRGLLLASLQGALVRRVRDRGRGLPDGVGEGGVSGAVPADRAH